MKEEKILDLIKFIYKCFWKDFPYVMILFHMFIIMSIVILINGGIR